MINKKVLALLAVIGLALAASLLAYSQRQLQADPVITTHLYRGWNQFSYLGPTQPVADGLAGAAGKFSSVWWLDAANGRWVGYDPTVPAAVNELQELRQFSAYMILMTAEADLVFDLGLTPGQYPSIIATEWFDLFLILLQESAFTWSSGYVEMTQQGVEGFSPPVAARALGYASVTLYEAIVHGMPDYQSLVGQLNGLQAMPQPEPDKEYHWPSVANSALANFSRALFLGISERNRLLIEDMEERFVNEYKPKLSDEVFGRSVAFGLAIADAIYGWSITDGGHLSHLNNFPDYTPPTGSGLWVPTPPGFAPALQAYWGDNRPFVLESGAECDPGRPVEFSVAVGSDFYNAALEVYDVSKNLSEEQEEIAIFWRDNPGETPSPAGHWVSILTQIIRQRGYPLDVAAEAYAKLAIAQSDAFVSCWYAKFHYNVLRPVTYINNNIDPGWAPLFATPPFPSYSSGHSTQSGAAAEVLTHLFGENFAFTDATHEVRGLPSRSYEAFWEAANEATVSRLYGGIHYRFDNEDGLEQGKCIAARVLSLNFRRT